MHAKYQLITTHEYLLQYAAEYKTENKSQHHITIFTLLSWVWKPPEKPKMGKPMQLLEVSHDPIHIFFSG